MLNPPVGLRYVLLDTMTQTRFTGNPTPTFILDDTLPWPSDQLLQRIANELKQSESAFLRKLEDSETFLVRWFTPIAEEFLCGHGTLAAAMALYLDSGITIASFVTKQGLNLSSKLASPTPSFTGALSFVIAFPVIAPLPHLAPDDLYKQRFAEALGIKTSDVVELSCNELRDVNIELDSRIDFSAVVLSIDAEKLRLASPPGTRSQVVTRRMLGGYDFAKRVFAYGGEDEATGSTYCGLGPYWAARLGKSTLRVTQPSNRGGWATLEVGEKTVECTAWAILAGSGEVYVE